MEKLFDCFLFDVALSLTRLGNAEPWRRMPLRRITGIFAARALQSSFARMEIGEKFYGLGGKCL
ncbi:MULTISPECIES: hypothetical protein [unclassified Novosphingobium]|uniref:hypothetical protein n=1 Tax=unclassified Novosphingobium TaxID=2644732 RepID=UPI0025DDD826|nr:MULTISPECIES: hypothetical protein [unclassified Novosphingobium]MDR6707578.1 hypothetical protein [Novosphingobium sp. 1748]